MLPDCTVLQKMKLTSYCGGCIGDGGGSVCVCGGGGGGWGVTGSEVSKV